MRLHPDVIEQVRQRLQIVDLFEPASLRRVGGEFLTRCPWHEDRRPSLSLNPSKNLAYCHVCARGTDAIGWWMEQQGLSFQEAVLQLAERLGIAAEPFDAADQARLQQEMAERKRLYALRQTQRQTFAERLWRSEGAAALAYLQGRGLTPQTIRDWQLGWNGERVMVPLNDPQGRTVAFSGRLLNHQNGQPGGAPKYRNSRNDLLYQKSQLLFGLDRAREGDQPQPAGGAGGGAVRCDPPRPGGSQQRSGGVGLQPHSLDAPAVAAAVPHRAAAALF